MDLCIYLLSMERFVDVKDGYELIPLKPLRGVVKVLVVNNS